MQTLGGRGLATLEPTADGWHRLSLSAPAPGAESVRIQLIPRQGLPEDTGDLVFGGGVLWVEEPSETPDVAAGVSGRVQRSHEVEDSVSPVRE